MSGKKLEREKELFFEYLRQNGLKKTHQKDLILETFLDNEGHMSVEDIYALVKRRDKKVGIVTVFRTLKSLTACGMAKEISLGDGLTRFEHCYHHPLHHHIICTKCHKVIEFLSPELERVQRAIVAKYGFQAQQERIQIHGLCRDCREQRPSADGPRPGPDTGKIFARDAIKMALALQREGLEFYRSAANHNQDPAGREIFQTLVAEEEGHARALEQELEQMQKQEKGLAEAPVFLHADPGEMRQVIASQLPGSTPGELCLDARRSLEIALRIEQRAAGFFREYAEKFTDTEGKRVFLRFADQTMQHHASISRRAELGASASA